MTRLAVFDEAGNAIEPSIGVFESIAEKLAGHDILLQRWSAHLPLSPDAGQEEVLQAYKDSVDRMQKEYGIQSVDVVSLRPDHPQKTEFRQKFRDEHTHADFEIRFFVEGQGLFYLHLHDRVFLVLCEQGDLISVPAKTRHWFDMGENPDFTCIRLFTTENGWVANFTGSDIARRFPDMDTFISNLS
ncbi:MAG: cupin [Gammaproteobacteria bacterium]|nr:MAG: cupin [Gammaproteobacteria bacterium]